MKCISHCNMCSSTRSNQQSSTHLALLVAVGQQLQTVCGDGQELGVALLQQGNHPLQAVGQTHGHLSSLLVQQQVVERGDGVEEHRLHGRTGGRETGGITKRMAHHVAICLSTSLIYFYLRL